MCSVISFPVAAFISTKNSFTVCPSFNLKVFERELLYEIWPYTGSFIICLGVYNPIYSSSNSSCVKLNLYIAVRHYGSFRQHFFFDEINQLLPVPDMCVQSLELNAGYLVIVAIPHSTNHNHQSCIWQLRDVTSRIFARMFSQIHHRWLVVSRYLLSCLPNLSWTFLQ